MIKKYRILKKNILQLSLGLALGLALSVSHAQAAKIFKTIKYYTVSGTTSEELDQSLENNGPILDNNIEGNNKLRHHGATIVSFDPKIVLSETNDYCSVQSANINIHAKVYLPQWKERAKTTSIQLALVWDTLSKDIKRHEESHIIIARAHASKIERKIRRLRREKNCVILQKQIKKISYNILQQHEEAQKYFDRSEAKNFDKRFYTLLSNASTNLTKK